MNVLPGIIYPGIIQKYWVCGTNVRINHQCKFVLEQSNYTVNFQMENVKLLNRITQNGVPSSYYTTFLIISSTAELYLENMSINERKLVINKGSMLINRRKLVNNEGSLLNNEERLLNNEERLVNNEERLVNNEESMVINEESMLNNEENWSSLAKECLSMEKVWSSFEKKSSSRKLSN